MTVFLTTVLCRLVERGLNLINRTPSGGFDDDPAAFAPRQRLANLDLAVAFNKRQDSVQPAATTTEIEVVNQLYLERSRPLNVLYWWGLQIP